MTTKDEALKLALEALSPWAGEDANHTEQYAAYQALREVLAEQPAQQEPVAKIGMYEHKCPNVTGHRGPSFVCQKAGHGVGQNSYCKGCTCPEALNTSPQPVGHLRMGPRQDFVTTGAAGDLEINVWHPVYTSQPARKPWVGLTDEEIEIIFNNWPTYHLDHEEFARVIENILREKNS